MYSQLGMLNYDQTLTQLHRADATFCRRRTVFELAVVHPRWPTCECSLLKCRPRVRNKINIYACTITKKSTYQSMSSILQTSLRC